MNNDIEEIKVKFWDRVTEVTPNELKNNVTIKIVSDSNIDWLVTTLIASREKEIIATLEGMKQATTLTEAMQKGREEALEEVLEKLKCNDCDGHGKVICSNPDHTGIEVGLYGADNNRIGCPVCGHDEYHRTKDDCEKCGGTGKSFTTTDTIINDVKNKV